MNLLSKKCVPCEGSVPPFTKQLVEQYLPAVSGWVVNDDYKKISREFKFRDFEEAIKFVNRVADLAEEEGHHPDIYVFYSLVKLELWTHAIGGLAENDFILAAKINELIK